MDYMDEDGYPTKETLALIKEWPFEEGWQELLDLVASLWEYSEYSVEISDKVDFLDKPVKNYALSTMGWSGNESLVEALQYNWRFWDMCWYSSRAGGHYVFQVRSSLSEINQYTGN